MCPLGAMFFGDPGSDAWCGSGSPGAHVVYPDTRSGEEVAIMRVVPRDDDG